MDFVQKANGWGVFMQSELKRIESYFIWRRAFRSPSRTVVRADLVDAFDMKKTRASSLLTEEARASGGRLLREGNKVRAPEWATAPEYAGEADLMAKLEAGLSAFAFTGLRQDELPLNIVSWRENLPPKPGVFSEIVRAIGKQRAICVQYVSMRQGDNGKWRRVLPLSLDRMGEQWRVCVQDLEKEEYPLRSLVLARITNVSENEMRMPKGFQRANAFDTDHSYEAKLDLKLTEEQKKALTNELRIRNGKIKLPSRSEHEFGIAFCAGAPSETAVWPPLVELNRI